MSETKQPKQFSIAGYTPGGYQVNISFTMPEIPNTWDWFDNRMGELGLSPRPVHKVIKRETMSHVACRHHYNKNSVTTPHIAFYSASQHLELRYLHIYMDSATERNAFEQATGITIASIPAYDADSHPKRDGSPRSQKYIIALPHPVTIEYTEETFTADDGSEGTRKHFIRYITPPQTPIPNTSVGVRPVAPEQDTETEPTSPTDRTLNDKISDFHELGRKLPQSNHNNSVGAQHIAPESQSKRNAWNTPISPFAPPAQGTTRSRDDQRRKITKLRVHGRDLAIGDCVRMVSMSYDQPRQTSVGTIEAIEAVDPVTKMRPAVVRVDGRSYTQKTKFEAGDNNLPQNYHTIVGGSKIDTAQADPNTYDMAAAGATWRTQSIEANVS